MSYSVDDIADACESFAREPRVLGQPAFPDYQSMTARIEECAKRRRPETGKYHECGRCHNGYVLTSEDIPGVGMRTMARRCECFLLWQAVAQ